MLYPIEITKPFADRYGSKKSIRLPQKIEVIKSVSLNILDLLTLSNKVASLPVAVKFDLCKFSLLLNNGNDEVTSDAPAQLSLFKIVDDWNGGGIFSPNNSNTYYNKERVILNKKVIKNSVHYAVFKMTDDLIQYIAINAGTQAFGDYLRSDDFKLMLYVEAS